MKKFFTLPALGLIFAGLAAHSNIELFTFAPFYGLFRITIIKFVDNRVYKNYIFDPGIELNLRFVYDLPL